MLHYDYPLFRPPAEARNVILQVTLGCSYNRCSFCSMYTSKKYQERELSAIFKDIDTLTSIYPSAHRIFLADGDALALKTDTLIKILAYLKTSFPQLSRVSSYASAQNILAKSHEELVHLKENGLTLIYYGIETGDDVLLKKITKGVSQQAIIESLNKVSHSGIKISATVILGLGGKKYTQEHIKETAKVINQTTVNYLATLQLGLEEDAKENFYKHFPDFSPIGDIHILEEQKRFLEQIHPSNKIIFRSNHGSNALHLSGTLPKDTSRLVEQLNAAIALGDEALVPRAYRGF